MKPSFVSSINLKMGITMITTILVLLSLFNFLSLSSAMTKLPPTNSNSNHTNNNLQAAIKDMRAKSFYGFAILLQMLNNTAQLNLNDVTFFVPQDPQLSNISISVDRIEAFVLSHSIAMPLLFDDLVQFPTGSIVPSRYRNRMLRIHNHGRGNFVVNNALVNVPNVCSDYSKGIKCHGVNKVITYGSSSYGADN